MKNIIATSIATPYNKHSSSLNNKAQKQSLTNCQLLPYKFIKRNNSGKKVTIPLANNFQWLQKYIQEQPYQNQNSTKNQCYYESAISHRDKNKSFKSIKNDVQQNIYDHKDISSSYKIKYPQLVKKSNEIKIKNSMFNVDAKKANINFNPANHKEKAQENTNVIFQERSFKLKKRHFRNKSTQIYTNININQNTFQNKYNNINYIPENKTNLQFRRTNSKQNYERNLKSQQPRQQLSKSINNLHKNDKNYRKYSQNYQNINHPIIINDYSIDRQIQGKQLTGNTKKFLKSVKNLRWKKGGVNSSILTSKNIFDRMSNSLERSDLQNNKNFGNIHQVTQFNLGVQNLISRNKSKLKFKNEISHKKQYLFQVKDLSNENKKNNYYVIQSTKDKKYKHLSNKLLKSKQNTINIEDINIQPWKQQLQYTDDEQTNLFTLELNDENQEQQKSLQSKQLIRVKKIYPKSKILVKNLR